MGSKNWIGKTMSKATAGGDAAKPAKPGKRAALTAKIAAMRKK